MRLQAVSIGPALGYRAVATGAVHSVFPHALNMVVGDQLWTVLAAGRPDLPFGIRVAADTLSGLPVHPGDPVSVRGGFLAMGKQAVMVDFRNAPHWQVSEPVKLEPGLEGRLAIVTKVAGRKAWRHSAFIARDVTSHLARDSHLLADVLAKAVGRGPGLTPAGDDVLVGILAVLALPQSGDPGHVARNALTRLLPALLPKTTSLSAYLVRQAMEGHCSKALCDLLCALAAGSSAVDLMRTITGILATGATSGADMCMGIAAAATGFLAPTVFEEAA